MREGPSESVYRNSFKYKYPKIIKDYFFKKRSNINADVHLRLKEA
jgi:hypothetical protein